MMVCRDLKTSNILYNNRGELKTCDFGLARQYGSPLRPYTQVRRRAGRKAGRQAGRQADTVRGAALLVGCRLLGRLGYLASVKLQPGPCPCTPGNPTLRGASSPQSYACVSAAPAPVPRPYPPPVSYKPFA